jgi:hypothetical protein
MAWMGTDECLPPKFQEVIKAPDYTDFKKITEIFQKFFLEER